MGISPPSESGRMSGYLYLLVQHDSGSNAETRVRQSGKVSINNSSIDQYSGYSPDRTYPAGYNLGTLIRIIGTRVYKMQNENEDGMRLGRVSAKILPLRFLDSRRFITRHV